jgi:hypothetical protein
MLRKNTPTKTKYKDLFPSKETRGDSNAISHESKEVNSSEKYEKSRHLELSLSAIAEEIADGIIICVEQK